MKSSQVRELWQEGTINKRAQLQREIDSVPDERLRANLNHSFSKLMIFMSEDIQQNATVFPLKNIDVLGSIKKAGFVIDNDSRVISPPPYNVSLCPEEALIAGFQLGAKIPSLEFINNIEEILALVNAARAFCDSKNKNNSDVLYNLIKANMDLQDKEKEGA